MASKHSLPSSLTSSSSSFVRKFSDSTVIGYSQQPQQQQYCEPSLLCPLKKRKQKQKPRVVFCNFEIKIPINALRIDMTILVSINGSSCSSSNSNRRCYIETGLSASHPRPSVSYKITICTPRRQQEQHPQVDPTSNSITTLKWSSKFTMANDLDENINPFHEWSGSFALDEKPKNTPPLAMEDLSFHQLEGILIGNYCNDVDADVDTNAADVMTTDDFYVAPPRKKHRRELHELVCSAYSAT